MIEWFNNLDVFFQILVILGSASSIIMFIQLILLIIGIEGADSSFDGIDGSIDDVINDGSIVDIFGLRLLTVRNLFIFLSMFSWSCLLLHEWTNNYPLSIIIALLFALIIVIIVSFIMKQAMKLENEGNVLVENAVGKKGSCYLMIPKKRTGVGKVNVLVQERLFEFEAYTDEEEDIPTGSQIEVSDTWNNILIVKRVKGE